MPSDLYLTVLRRGWLIVGIAARFIQDQQVPFAFVPMPDKSSKWVTMICL